MLKPVSELTPGIIVDADVEAQGTVLLKAHTVLTEAHIQRLKRWGVNQISITDQNDISRTTEAHKQRRQAEYKTRHHNALTLFKPFRNDPDMTFLKSCILDMLEEKYHD